MKRMAIFFMCLIFAVFSWNYGMFVNVEAEGSEKQEESLETVLKEIRKSQGLKENEAIDCGKVSDEQFEALGEAFMGIMHPDPEEHELMDRVMGGEGSENLATMERIMGARYLGCYPGGAFDWIGPGRGMMGGWMMEGGPFSGRWGMRDFGYGRGWMHYGWGGILMWILFLIIIIAVIYLIFHVTRSRIPGIPSGDTPLDVLKKRYARGEITKEEFDRIKKDLEA